MEKMSLTKMYYWCLPSFRLMLTCSQRNQNKKESKNSTSLYYAGKKGYIVVLLSRMKVKIKYG